MGRDRYASHFSLATVPEEGQGFNENSDGDVCGRGDAFIVEVINVI